MPLYIRVEALAVELQRLAGAATKTEAVRLALAHTPLQLKQMKHFFEVSEKR
jgi:hypothetical protein